jgi:hypothetical protein
MKYAQHWRKLRAAQPRELLKETHLHSGNTMAPCIVIAERAAEALRKEHRLEASKPYDNCKEKDQVWT